jgi:hypothetical protein
VAGAGDEKSANAPSHAPATQPRTLSAPSSFAPAPRRRRRTATPTAAQPGRPGANGPTAAPVAAAATVGDRATACWRETAALAATAKRRRRRNVTWAAARAGPPGPLGLTVRRLAAAATGSGSGTAWWTGSAVYARRTSSASAISRWENILGQRMSAQIL